MLCCLLFFSSCLFVPPTTFVDDEGHQVWRIDYNTSSQSDLSAIDKLHTLVSIVEGGEADVWQHQEFPGNQRLSVLDLRIPPAGLLGVARILAANKLTSRVLIINVPNNCHSPKHTGVPPLLPAGETITEKAFFANFHQLADINRYARQLASTYPTLASTFTIGTSWQKRKILALRITAPSSSTKGVASKAVPGYVSSGKPVIFLEAGIHSREWVAHTTVLWIATKLLQGYNEMLPQVSHLAYENTMLDTFEFIIVPSVNVDGYVYTWSVFISPLHYFLSP
jgi:hypothetical protein